MIQLTPSAPTCIIDHVLAGRKLEIDIIMRREFLRLEFLRLMAGIRDP
jgi:hypothetical protein